LRSKSETRQQLVIARTLLEAGKRLEMRVDGVLERTRFYAGRHFAQSLCKAVNDAFCSKLLQSRHIPPFLRRACGSARVKSSQRGSDSTSLTHRPEVASPKTNKFHAVCYCVLRAPDTQFCAWPSSALQVAALTPT